MNRAQLHGALKTIHLLGLATAGGGTVAMLLATRSGDAVGAVALAGLGVAAVSGAGMIVANRMSPARQAWLLPHLVLAGCGVVVVLVAATPLGSALPGAGRAALALAAAVLLAATVTVGVLKPRRRGRTPRERRA